MRILVTGKEGQLGWELTRTLQTFGTVVPVGRLEMDLERPDSICTAIRSIRPDLIVNAAAYTAVDPAEADAGRAYAVNCNGPGVIAEEAKRIGAGLIHYSTDYVFDGTKQTPYVESDATAPCNIYGQSKLGGEQAVAAVGGAHLILRTSWVYGTRGNNFLKTMLRLASEKDELRIVTDQIGAPTWARLIAESSSHILATGRALLAGGALYHLTAGGMTSWFGFAKTIFNFLPVAARQRLRADTRLVPVSTNEYLAAAHRPANSRLCCDKLQRDFNVSLPDWQVGLQLCLSELSQ
jgi:dTDP-4-dehydrorhamnose reductase